MRDRQLRLALLPAGALLQPAAAYLPVIVAFKTSLVLHVKCCASLTLAASRHNWACPPDPRNLWSTFSRINLVLWCPIPGLTGSELCWAYFMEPNSSGPTRVVA